MCLFDRSTSLKIGSTSITCEKNNIESVCGNSKFSYHFLFPLFFFHWRCPNVHKRCTGAMSEEQEMELEAVCLSRLYFALNRIQGSLQIDKKKRRETSILECSKSRNDTCTKKDKMKRKHSSGVRKCRRRERSASWMESREFTIFTFTGSRTIRAEFITRFEFGGGTRWRAVQTRFRPIGRPIVL